MKNNICDERNFVMYCIYHKRKYVNENNTNFVYFGVNEIYPKEKTNENNILEYELNKYNPFLQKRGYMETSVYLHVYWNELYKNKDMIGFSQYDMKHNEQYNNLKTDTIYILNTGQSIVFNKKWNNLMFPEFRNLDFLINHYNQIFNKNYSMKELESMPLSLWQTNIYPVTIYEKLCKWLEILVEDIYPWSNEEPYETHFGSIGGYTERALAIFNAFEIYEGIKYNNLNIQHVNTEVVKEQYNKNSFLNKYSQDVHTKFIENITGQHPEADFCMFKSQCYLNDIKYSCERIHKNGKNGLYFKRDDWTSCKEYAFDIEGEDPRLIILNEEIYVIFISLSPYEKQNRCIGVTKFNEWNPVFLQIENMKKNPIEKNWAPFVKDNKIYFVYNYDPLIILFYDLNPEGICQVIFKQDNINLPINTSMTYIRGGSNLIHYKEGYFIGGCHSRIHTTCFEHYTHIILLDTNNWKLVYVSKPVLYLSEIKDNLNSWWLSPGSTKPLDIFHNIITDKTPNIIQDPISLYEKKGKYFITINIRDCLTLLYEISYSNLFDFIKTDQPIGYYDNYIRNVLL